MFSKKSKLNKPKIYVVLGPTASGKSDYAVKLAKEINGEIVSADSRQVYKYLNVGSGKITSVEKMGIQHYGLDIANPKKWSKVFQKKQTTFSVQNYLKFAERAIKRILKKDKTPIICGGTGFYVDSLLYGLPKNAKVNSKLRRKLEKEDLDTLLNKIKELNLEKYLKLIADPNQSERHNKRRLIRLIEILDNKKSHGLSPEIEKLNRETKYRVEFIFMYRSKEELQQRIQNRLHNRLIAIGRYNLLNEVNFLRDKLHLADDWLISLGLEYKYVTLYLRGEITREQMISEIEHKSWQYAKRQILWNKRYQRL